MGPGGSSQQYQHSATKQKGMQPGGALQNGLPNGTASASKKAMTSNSYNKYNSPKKTDKQGTSNNAGVPNNP